MWCISAYEYVVSEEKMTKIFAVYLQPSGFPSQSSNMLSSAAVDSLGDMVSSCYTLILMLILLFPLYMWTVMFDVHILHPLFLKRGQYCLSLHQFEEFLVAMQSGILHYLHFYFSWFTTWMCSVVE